MSSTGPLYAGNEIAAMEVETAGMTLVKSISLTCTPGETKNPISMSPFYLNL
jgi:hypothetical protein